MAKKSSRISKSSRSSALPRGAASAPVTNTASPAPELEPLNAFIGRWITEGQTAAGPEAGPVPIVASDVYQWAPGGHFVMHPAYGRIGIADVGGLEIIGYDPATHEYRTHFFDNRGNVTRQTLSYRDGIWTWQGAHARCTGVFTDGGKLLTASHERSEDGVHWTPSMTVTLRRVE